MAEPNALAVMEAWTDAIVRSDRAAADELLHEDFVLRSAGGVGDVDKQKWLDTLDHIDTRALHAIALEGCSFGDVVVVAGRWIWDASLPERDLSGEYSIVDVLLLVDGQWRPRWRISTKMGE
ncbi:MAG TPA: nuclear transport factor 2 family protein [Gaiellaceae bacterium]|nr:nuclear transport factor 2 family protein [Gaiellaceae bacterium]